MPVACCSEDRDVEVDDLRPTVRPQEVSRLDVAVVDAVLVQMDEPFCHLASEINGVLGCEQTGLDHLPDVEPVHELEHDERRSPTGKQVSVDDLHDVGMIRNAKQRAVFLLEPIQRGMAVAQDQLDRPRHVAKRIDGLVDNAKRPGPAQSLVDDVLTRELRSRIELRVVELGLVRGFRRFLRGRLALRLLGLVGMQNSREFRDGPTGCGTLVGLESAQALQPAVEALEQLGPQFRRLRGKHAFVVKDLCRATEGLLTSE